MHEHQDTLRELNKDIPLQDKVEYIHKLIIEKHEFIERVSIALYDPKTDMLSTYANSTTGTSPLNHYQASLSSVPSLQEIVLNGRPRVANDLSIYQGSKTTHSKSITARYAASYTLPMFNKGDFFGFIFFNAQQKNCFKSNVLFFLDMMGHLISMTLVTELITTQTMTATLKTARGFSHHRDAETGTHLERMAYYSRLIAQEVTEKFNLSDEFIEYIFLYAPLHDIGKIGVPDKVLLKPAKLTEDEFEMMKQHVDKGRVIIDEILANFQLDHFPYTEVLRNIVAYHHESLNGEGYIKGLKGDEIPIEARIIAVADVFDALTSHRPYKTAWSNERAFKMLREMAGSKLDPACVEALCRNETIILEIQQRFVENMLDEDSA